MICRNPLIDHVVSELYAHEYLITSGTSEIAQAITRQLLTSAI